MGDLAMLIYTEIEHVGFASRMGERLGKQQGFKGKWTDANLSDAVAKTIVHLIIRYL